jgi:hypothetical protein
MKCPTCRIGRELSPANELLRKSQQTADLISEVMSSMDEAS